MSNVLFFAGPTAGVAALQKFLEIATSDAGIACVVVQHLAPDHESLMAEILSRHISMPVLQIADEEGPMHACIGPSTVPR